MASPTTPLGVDRAGLLLELAIWAGLVTGVAELAKVGLDLFYSDFTYRSRDALWMIPAVDAGLFAVVGLVLLAIQVWVRVPWNVAAGLFVGLGTGLVLLLVQRLHPAAAVLLAAGIGTQASRLVVKRITLARRLIHRSVIWLAGLACLAGLLMVGWRSVRQRVLLQGHRGVALGSPNVLLLILDTVRAADLSLYGYARRTTPELERLAERGTVFDRAFAPAPWTLPAHASIFTGREALQLGVNSHIRLAKHWLTLAEALQARGYATVGFVANTEYASWESGLGQGFGYYDDYPVTFATAWKATAFGSVLYPAFQALGAPVFKRLRISWLPKLEGHRSAPQIADSFLAWLDQPRQKPFFAFLNFMDAHDYTAPEPFRTRFRSSSLRRISPWAWADTPPVRLTPADLRPRQDAYDGAIAYLDSEIEKLFSELKRRHLLQRTLVIVTADHGEEFGEHGLASHGHSLYRPSLQVPLAIWLPGYVAEGRRVTAPVSLQDIPATVLELADSGRATPLPGRSLSRFWMGEDRSSGALVASVGSEPKLPNWYPVARGNLRSVAFDGWRYIRNDGDGTEELYDFEHDLLERWNLIGTAEGNRLLPRYRAAVVQGASRAQ
jgi:arylsulfatase A-like enzyme